MQLNRLQLKNFRCFNELDINLSSPIVLIEGKNGSGKTTILEALSYLCYLRSFRTHITKDMIHEDSNNFFVKIELSNQEEPTTETYQIKAGFSGRKRLVKINDKAVQSYKELMHYYRTITLTEDDLGLIKEGPELRRSFIDQHIMLHDSQSLQDFRKYKKLLANRNALLFKGSYTKEDYFLWTQSLWAQSNKIQRMRISALKAIDNELEAIIETNFPKLKVVFKYEPKDKKICDSFEEFWDLNSNLYEGEQFNKRSLFGAHLDDFSIMFLDKKTKAFASRGQQKLVVLLLKVAQIKLLSKNNHGSVIFLLDDFMTDFDSNRIEELVLLLCELNTQLIFTCPLLEGHLRNILIEKKALVVPLNL